jgi:hypothetical protein
MSELRRPDAGDVAASRYRLNDYEEDDEDIYIPQ